MTAGVATWNWRPLGIDGHLCKGIGIMDKPLEIVFHNLPSSPEEEAEIRDWVDKLERRFGHLIGCRVAVELLNHRHRTGNVVDVHIEMGVPGGEVVVTREPHRLERKYARTDLRASLHAAFKAAERRLLEYKQHLQHQEKPRQEVAAGQISQLYPDEGHGFVLTLEGAQLYFDRNALAHHGDFDKLRVGDRVHYIPAFGETGPAASKVWLAGGEPD